MSARTKARKRAMDILFASDVRGTPIPELLGQEAERAADEPDRAASWRYAREIVLGVIEHAEEIDGYIVETARDWTLERMPALDRSILRVAIWELKYNDEIPAAVAITEAVSAAGEYSTDASGKFIHGVLGRISEQ
ncbi:MAG: transcription antitermination factor NusB [Pseudoclavibacter sp.]